MHLQWHRDYLTDDASKDVKSSRPTA